MGLKSNRALQSAAGCDCCRCSAAGAWLAADVALPGKMGPSLSPPWYLLSTLCFGEILGPAGTSVPPDKPVCRFRLEPLTNSWNRKNPNEDAACLTRTHDRVTPVPYSDKLCNCCAMYYYICLSARFSCSMTKPLLLTIFAWQSEMCQSASFYLRRSSRSVTLFPVFSQSRTPVFPLHTASLPDVPRVWLCSVVSWSDFGPIAPAWRWPACLLFALVIIVYSACSLPGFLSMIPRLRTD